ncbi:cobalamin-binding protein [Candidatus Bathyarchaeota archaeon]|nr:cobalamin-binding protein [Candidatus Bathyarchaeota archaeon]
MSNTDVLFNEMSDAIEWLDDEKAMELVETALKTGMDPVDVIEKGFSKGLKIVGDRFGKGEAFLTELVAAANIMEEVSDKLSGALTGSSKKVESKGRVLIGTVSGDVHTIGKNILKTLLEVNGFEVQDLGEDVPAEKFVEKVRELKPDILGLSALMTTTITEQRNVIEALKKAGLRDSVKVLVGGAAVTSKWAKEIGADGYAENASDAVQLAMGLVG